MTRLLIRLRRYPWRGFRGCRHRKIVMLAWVAPTYWTMAIAVAFVVECLAGVHLTVRSITRSAMSLAAQWKRCGACAKWKNSRASLEGGAGLRASGRPVASSNGLSGRCNLLYE